MFKLNLYDFEKNEIVKTVEREFCPTYIYIEFEKVREEVEAGNITRDVVIVDKLCDSFLKFFPTLTKEEYYEHTVIGDIMFIYGLIIGKAATIRSFPLKNA
jgi:hypothetical protein